MSEERWTGLKLQRAIGPTTRTADELAERINSHADSLGRERDKYFAKAGNLRIESDAAERENKRLRGALSEALDALDEIGTMRPRTYLPSPTHPVAIARRAAFRIRSQIEGSNDE